jgi:hypothetical protein
MTSIRPERPLRSSTGPAVDVLAVLAALQDQLDDLTATVAAQLTTIDRLVADRTDGDRR